MAIKIAPSILGVKEEDLVNVCNELISSGADYIHFDVMDGVFVENKSFSPETLAIVRKGLPEAFIDVHLMIVDVEKSIDAYAHAGASLITFHYEACKESQIPTIINMIHARGIKAGISIKPNTDVEVIDKYLDLLDLVLVMSVEPGKGGQSFIESSLDKIAHYSSIKGDRNYEIEVDGGINDSTGKLCVNKGVDVLVAGSYIIKSNDYKARIDSLK